MSTVNTVQSAATNPGFFTQSFNRLREGARKAGAEVVPFFTRVWATVREFFANLGPRIMLWLQSLKASVIKLGHQVAAWPKETKIAGAIAAVGAVLLGYCCCKGSEKKDEPVASPDGKKPVDASKDDKKEVE